MDSQNKFLIQMSGAPGSGKSTLANLLAKSIDGIIIDHDMLKSFFLENNIPFDQSTKLAYRIQWVLGEDLIKQGRNIIIDSTCNFSNVLNAGNELAQKYSCDYKYVECRVSLDDLDMLDRRLQSRVSLRSQRTGVTCPPADANVAHNGEDYHASFKRWIENPCRPDSDLVVVDSKSSSPDECLEYVLKQIISPAPRTRNLFSVQHE